MKIRGLTEHEMSALMVVTHVMQQCMAKRSPAVPLKIALSQSKAGPLDADGKNSFKRLIDAGLEHQLLVQQGSDIFVGQLGKVIMAFSELSRGTPENFEEQTRDHHVLESMLAAIAGDRRFSPDNFYGSPPARPPTPKRVTLSERLAPQPAKGNAWSVVWIIFILIAIGGLLKFLNMKIS